MIAVESWRWCLAQLPLVRRGTIWWLQAENPDYPDYEITDQENLRIWGVVTHVVHEVRRCQTS